MQMNYENVGSCVERKAKHLRSKARLNNKNSIYKHVTKNRTQWSVLSALRTAASPALQTNKLAPLQIFLIVPVGGICLLVINSFILITTVLRQVLEL